MVDFNRERPLEKKEDQVSNQEFEELISNLDDIWRLPDLDFHFESVSAVQAQAVLDIWSKQKKSFPKRIAELPDEQFELLCANAPENLYLSMRFYPERYEAGDILAVSSDFFRSGVADGDLESYFKHCSGSEFITGLKVFVFEIGDQGKINDLNTLRLADGDAPVPAAFMSAKDYVAKLESIRDEVIAETGQSKYVDIHHHIEIYREFKDLHSQ